MGCTKIIYDLLPEKLFMGYGEEQLSRTLTFDISQMLAELPGGVPMIAYMRPRDELGYLASGVTLDGSTLTWELSAHVMQYKGIGGAQIVLVDESGEETHILKSHVMQMLIGSSIPLTGGEPPEPWETWLEQILAAAARAESAAADAEAQADRAETAEAGAQQALIDAGSPVLYGREQTLTDAQQQTARGNIAAASAADVSDLKSALSQIFSDNAKAALLNCFQHVAWIDDQGQAYYDALEDALYEAGDTAYIEAVYTKGWGKYAGDSVNSLKPDLIVTYYSQQGASGIEVPAENYTLTGNMVAGLQTFTVTYREKIATFNAQILNGLPSGYTKLQYVQTDGRQYIDTGISETQVDSAIYKMRITGIAAGTDSYASGQHFFSSMNFYFPLLKNKTSGEVVIRRFGNETLSSGSKALAWDKDIDYEFKAYIDNDAIFVNGQQLFEIAAGSTEDSTKKMHLFTFGGYPDMEKFRFCGRFYGLTVYGQTGDVVLSLIPAKNSNNVAGVYDAISGSFFTSNTTYPLQAGEVA